uniref:Uncharacterized protein n=1 Tax=Mesocestoides corti TaxID=53468 RepID=A0A5K3FPC4_MESCO
MRERKAANQRRTWMRAQVFYSGVGLGRRHIGPRWPQPILCLSSFQCQTRKISSQPKKDTAEVEYILSAVASVVDSDGRCLTCGSGF